MLLWLTLALAARADDLASAWARAGVLEARGDPSAACDELLPWLALYPQDYALALQIGWLAFSAERYREAEDAYRQAVALSSGAPEASVGLAWTLLRVGRSPEARALVEALPPGEQRDQLEAALPKTRWMARLGGSYTALPPEAGLKSATELRIGGSTAGRSLYAGVDLSMFAYDLSDVSVQGAKLARMGPRRGQGQGGPPGDETTEEDPPGKNQQPGFPGSLAQVEAPWVDLSVWTRAGARGKNLGAELIEAALLRTAPGSEPGFVLGGILYGAPPLNPQMEISLTRPREGAGDVGRVAVGGLWKVSVLGIAPQVALQRPPGALLPSAGATLWLLPEDLGVWVGGRYGPQVYTSLLDLGAHAAWGATERAGLWAGARLGSLDKLWFSASGSASWLDLGTTVRPAWMIGLLLRPAS